MRRSESRHCPGNHGLAQVSESHPLPERMLWRLSRHRPLASVKGLSGRSERRVRGPGVCTVVPIRVTYGNSEIGCPSSLYPRTVHARLPGSQAGDQDLHCAVRPRGVATGFGLCARFGSTQRSGAGTWHTRPLMATAARPLSAIVPTSATTTPDAATKRRAPASTPRPRDAAPRISPPCGISSFVPRIDTNQRTFGPDLRKYSGQMGNSAPGSRAEGFVTDAKPKPNLNLREHTPTQRATQRPARERRAS